MNTTCITLRNAKTLHLIFYIKRNNFIVHNLCRHRNDLHKHNSEILNEKKKVHKISSPVNINTLDLITI